MDSMNAVARAQPTARAQPNGFERGDPEAIDFVRFCYHRRPVGWPELYDEMCAVAGRGLYHGFAADDLGRIGIGFALDQMPVLATIVHRVVAEDHERRRLTVQAVRASHGATEPDAGPIAAGATAVAAAPSTDRARGDVGPADVKRPHMALAAGA